MLQDCEIALVIDGSNSQAEAIEVILIQEGYEVFIANDGRTAIALYQKLMPHIVIMDIHMPDQNGWQTAKKLREHSVEHFCPILFISATNSDENIIKSIEAGGDDFISLPLSLDVFKAKIAARRRISKIYRKFKMMQAEQTRDQEVAEQLFTRVIESNNVCLDIIETVKKAATIFSGDVILTAQSPDNAIHMFLGDFTGHGLKSIVGAFSLSEIFSTMINKGYPPKAVLQHINSKLHRVLPNDMFLAAALVSIMPSESLIQIWNAGLPDVLIFDGDTFLLKQRVHSFHPPLGIMKNMLSVDEVRYEIGSNDTIVMASDGIIEARNRQGVEYGEKRFIASCIKGMTNKQLSQTIMQRIEYFTKNTQQDDDISLITVPVNLLVKLEAKIKTICPILNNKLPPIDDCLETELWRWKLSLSGKQLARVDIVPIVMNYIRDIEESAEHWNNFYTILTELYVNSLDHGILGLCSSIKSSPEGFVEYFKERDKRLAALENGTLTIKLKRIDYPNGGKLRLKITDDGDGFDVESWLREYSSREYQTGLSGRGISLVQSLVQSLNYSDNGRCVEAEYVW